jgi:hypothetical protein
VKGEVLAAFCRRIMFAFRDAFPDVPATGFKVSPWNTFGGLELSPEAIAATGFTQIDCMTPLRQGLYRRWEHHPGCPASKLLFVKKVNKRPLVVLDAETFFAMIRQTPPAP